MVDVYGPLKEKHFQQVLDCVHGPKGVGVTPSFNWPLEVLRSELNVAMGWGYWRDDQLVAFVLWRDLGEEAEITALATLPAAQGHGVMRQLVEHIFNAHGYKFWLLEVHETNEKARKLYEILGFEEVGRRNRYYRDGASAIRYQREA